MLPQLALQLLAQWADLPTGRRRPERLDFLGLRTGVGDGYAVFLAFADDDPAPCLVVKIPREPAAASRLQHEWEVLRHFQRAGLREVAASLPRPVLWETIGEMRMLVTTAPLGQPIHSSANSPAEHFARVGDWLVQLACATRTTRPALTLSQSLQLTVQRLSAIFDLSEQEMTVIDGWLSQVEKLAGGGHGQAVLFAAHGSLNSRNIWLHHDQLTVVNWEHSRLDGLPLHDVFAFLTTSHLAADRRLRKSDHVRQFSSIYLADGSDARPVLRTIAGYCRALDIALEGVEPFFGIFLARAALEEYDRLLAAAERGYLPLLRDSERPARQPYRQAIKDQIRINLLRLFIQERDHFKVSVGLGAHGSHPPLPVQPAVFAR